MILNSANLRTTEQFRRESACHCFERLDCATSTCGLRSTCCLLTSLMEDVVGIPGGTKPFQPDDHDDWPADTAIDVSENVILGLSLGFNYRYWELVDELANDCNVEVRLPDQGRRGHAGPRDEIRLSPSAGLNKLLRLLVRG